MANILLFDIETSPNIVYSWAVGRKISLTHDNIIKERQIICICYKWYGHKKIHSLDWGRAQNDKALLKAFSDVISQADVAIGHNGDKYDIRFINGRLAYHDLDPIGEVTTIDTLKQSRKVFFINSHRLDYLGQFLNLGGKMETGGFSLWKSVMDGEAGALTKMIRYCKRDVNLLEGVYTKIRKYAPQTVHMGVLDGEGQTACKACGSPNTVKDGQRVKSTVVYQCRKCKDCGHFFRAERVKR